MTAIDAQLPDAGPAAGIDPPEYQPAEDNPCIGCTAEAGPGAPLGRIGDTVGPLCEACAWWCDGNLLVNQGDPQ
jgi:hypothetical protein